MIQKRFDNLSDNLSGRGEATWDVEKTLSWVPNHKQKERDLT